VAHFERFRTVLRTELDAEPLPSTVEVYRSVVSGRIRPPAAMATEVMPDFRRFRGEHATPALELHR
jgi:hypothetical protein